MNKKRYAADKPKNCKYCYFWNGRKRECSLTEERCYYLLPTKEEQKPKSRCDGCAYARNAPCIGFCMIDILADHNGNCKLSCICDILI